MRSEFEELLDTAADYSTTVNPSMARREELLGSIQAEIESFLPSGGVAWSVGRGGRQSNFGPVPWIRIFSKKHSPSTTSGFYVALLFAADGSSLYLSLNQGTSEFRSGAMRPIREPMLLDARTMAARSQFEGWDGPIANHGLTSIDLRPDSVDVKSESKMRVRNYERANIFALAYPRDDIPDDDRFRTDLTEVLRMLEALYESRPGAELIASTQHGSTQAVGKGQGMSADAAWNRATELRAEEVVIEHYVGLQYDFEPAVDRVADQKIGYDLRFTKGDEELHVEVKGTRNAGNQVNVTYGEVRHARTYEGSVLAVVSGIKVVMVDGEWMGQGGSLRIVDPWKPDDGSLTATKYVYRLPDQET